MTPPTFEHADSLTIKACFALGKTQKEISEMLGISRRTIVRWMSRGKLKFYPWEAETLARAVYPVDASLAAAIATNGGTTLVALGLEATAQTEARLPRGRLVELVVCAAAEALDASPRAMRPALAAAFETARDLGLDFDLLAEVLRERAPPSGGLNRSGRKGR